MSQIKLVPTFRTDHIHFNMKFVKPSNLKNFPKHQIFCRNNRGVTIGGTKGGTIPRASNDYGGAESLRGARNDCGGRKKSQQCHKYLLKYSTLLPKDLRFEHRGAKLASCPGRHLTSLRPCVTTYCKFHPCSKTIRRSMLYAL